MRAERVEELEAIKTGNWPRDINDAMRWAREGMNYAAECCRNEIKYLDSLEDRIQARDPDLSCYEPD